MIMTHCHKSSVHFVGFRGDEFVRAVRVWGWPDFIHAWHDHRMYGDVGPDDVIVLGPKGKEEISQFSWQDHELW